MPSLRRFALLVATLAGLAPAAQAEEEAALFARAPRPALDAKATPLAAPVEIGGTGWGPFKRLCVSRFIVRPDGGETPQSDPTCVRVESVRRDGATWHLALRTEASASRPAIRFTATRTEAGEVGPVTVTLPKELADTPPAMRTRMQDLLRIMLRAHGKPRGPVAPGAEFLLPLGTVDSDLTMARDGFVCRAEGAGTLRGRRVVLAACAAQGKGEVEPGRAITLDMAGWFVLDVETGLVLRHLYAASTFMAAAADGSMRALRLPSVSRLTLD